MIPNVAIVRIQSLHWRGFRIWIPLFLLWIPVLLACCIAGGIDFFTVITTFWGLLTGLRGTDVRVASNGSHVTVRIL